MRRKTQKRHNRLIQHSTNHTQDHYNTLQFCIVHATAIDEIQDSEDTLGTKNIKKQGHGSQRKTGLNNNVHPESTKNEIRIDRRRNIALLKWHVSNDKRVRRINIAPDWYDGAWKADGD
jgi:hypothetical protein